MNFERLLMIYCYFFTSSATYQYRQFVVVVIIVAVCIHIHTIFVYFFFFFFNFHFFLHSSIRFVYNSFFFSLLIICRLECFGMNEMNQTESTFIHSHHLDTGTKKTSKTNRRRWKIQIKAKQQNRQKRRKKSFTAIRMNEAYRNSEKETKRIKIHILYASVQCRVAPDWWFASGFFLFVA